MKRLILMRHAKSDWSGGPTRDHDRPLNARGQRACVKLGEWLRAHHLVPDEVLCSTAMRTRETYARLELPECALHLLKPLYLASSDVILDTLKSATGDTALLIGHNPGIGMMAEAVLREVPDNPSFAQYPTGATLVADFDVDEWSKAAWGKANARHFVVPRAL